MKTYDNEKEEIRGYGFPAKMEKLLVRLMSLNNYHEHMRAKRELVKEGNEVLPYLFRLVKSESAEIRKEAAKIMELIGHPSSIPVAIELLEDNVPEVRWIAAEDLIRTGRNCIRPLLNELVENGTSYYLRQGAHHVLSKLVREDDPEELKELLHVSLNGMDLPETIPVKAGRILRKNLV